MNPTAILGALALALATSIGAFFYGQKVGADSQVVKQAAIDKAIADTRQAALEGAANAIAKIKVRNTTIQGRVETVVRDNPVYRDCKHDADGMSLINETLTGRPGPTGGSSVPGVNAVN